MLDAIVWYATLQLAAPAVYPLVARAARPLDDCGWAISKVVGILVLAYVTWIATTLAPVPFTRWTLVAAAALLALMAWGGLARRDGLVAWIRALFRVIAAWELLLPRTAARNRSRQPADAARLVAGPVRTAFGAPDRARSVATPAQCESGRLGAGLLRSGPWCGSGHRRRRNTRLAAGGDGAGGAVAWPAPHGAANGRRDGGGDDGRRPAARR